MKDLHTSKQADWEMIPPEDWNKYQKLAAKTNGWVTPGNVISVVGAGLSAAGLRCIKKNKVGRGLAFLTAGRLCDIVDGKVAHATGTKSPKGEGVDVAIDKLLAAAAMYVAREAELVPDESIATFGGSQVVIAGVSMFAKSRKKEIHPSAAGKFAQFDMWAASCAYAIAERTEGRVSECTRAIGDVAMGGYGVHSGLAIIDYIKPHFASALPVQPPEPLLTPQTAVA